MKCLGILLYHLKSTVSLQSVCMQLIDLIEQFLSQLCSYSLYFW